jgi:hypothetical protein
MVEKFDNLRNYPKRQSFVTTDEEATEVSEWLDVLKVIKGIPKAVVITPEAATVFYKHRLRNRYISKTNLQRLMRDIQVGDWKVTGETIIFDDDDRLVDGQHRLLACMESGIPIKTYVVRGNIDKDAATSIDTGKAKTPGDLLTFSNFDEGHHLAACLRWINRIRTDGMQFERFKLTRDEMLEFMKDNPDVSLSLPYGRFIRQLVVPSLGAALHFEMAAKDRGLADKYFTHLQQGTGEVGSPTFVVRELLIKNKLHRAQLPVHIVAAMLIKAWNLLRTGRTAKIIRWYGDTQNEPYPKIR